MTLVARQAAVTDIGLHRKTNEDAYVAAPPLFAVCDGMGGALAGEVASGLAAETLTAAVAAHQPLMAAAEAANAAVFTRACGDEAHSGMGTTLTAVLLEGDVGHFVHIGDSRAYLLRGGQLQQLSDDHSLVGEMVREGRLTEEEAASHPHRSILSRALGTEPTVHIDEFEVDLLAGDVLLLCSDGLSGVVDAGAIRKALGRRDPEDAAQRLVAEARRQGGPDNITAVVVRLEAPPPGAPEGDDEVTLAVPADEAVTVVDAAPAPEAPAQTGGGDGAVTVVGPVAGGRAAAGPASAVSAGADEGLADTLAEDGREDDLLADTLPDDGPAVDLSLTIPPSPVPPAPEQPEAHAGAGHGVRRRLGCLAVALLLLVAVGLGGAVTLSAVYYVGVDDGRLTLYSGLPASLGPLHLHAVYRRSSVAYATLTPAQRDVVDARNLRGRGSALALATSLGMRP